MPWRRPIPALALAAGAHLGARHRGDTVIAHPIQVAGAVG